MKRRSCLSCCHKWTRVLWIACVSLFLSLAAKSQSITVTTGNLYSNQVTLQVTSTVTETGYFTLLQGSGATCGSATQTAAGESSTGATAFRQGSLSLTAGTAGNYSVQNLLQSSGYTACVTDGTVTPVSTSFTTTAGASLSANNWVNIGSAGFSAGTAQCTSLAFAPNGTPYVAFADGTNGSKLTVMEFNGSSWVTVGAAGFSATVAWNGSGAAPIALAFAPNGTPYVAYVDGQDGDTATVMEFNGSSWATVGGASFGSSVGVIYVALAFAPNGTPYVATADFGSNDTATVFEYNGSSWVTVGSSDFFWVTDGGNSLGFAFAPNGTPYFSANDGPIETMAYNGSAWAEVGSGFSDYPYAYNTFLAFSPNGTPYVAYDDGNNGDRASVIDYNGSSWAYVGSAGFSAGTIQYGISLAFAPSGTPYVAYEDVGNNYQATVMEYNGSSWVNAGLAAFSAGTAQTTSLAFAPNGIPYVAFEDGGNGNRATVMALLASTDTSQTITVTTPAPASAALSSYFYVAATASSGLAVSFYSSGSCSNSGAFYLITSGNGNCTVTFRQDGNSTYAPASNVVETVQATPAISIRDIPPGAVNGGSFTVTYNYTGNGTKSVSSSTTGICTVSSNTVNFVGSGTCTLTASATATSSYAAVTGNPQSFTIAAQKWDSGTVNLTVGSTNVPASYGPGSTPESIAESLQGSYSGFNVTAVNDTVYIEATTTDINPTYSLTATSNDGFSPPSFQGGSGNLGGGAGGSSSSTPVYCFGPPGSSFSSTGCTPSTNSMYDAVGNLTGYSDTVMGSWTNGYDTLNRLTSAQNTGTTSTSSQYAGYYLCWSYDSFGNRIMQLLQSSPCPASVTPSQPPATVYYNANNQVTFVSQSAPSTISAPTGFTYDAAGGVLNDGANQYVYDAEGRICAEASTPVAGFTTLTGYVYDAEGNRVAKGNITTVQSLVSASNPYGMSCDPSVNGFTTAGNETDYVLGPGGEPVTELAQDANGRMNWQRTYVYAAGALIATYDPSPDTGQPAVSFRLTDWLGTMRVTTDASGVAQSACTGLPFGDGQGCSGNVPDSHYFTGKERDSESGNDYFGARYYASTMGRFLSPDWSAQAEPVPYAKLDDPQSLNLYAYVRNNPLGSIDADGHCNAGGSCSALDAYEESHGQGPLGSDMYGTGVGVGDFFNDPSRNSAAAQQQTEHDPTLPTAADPPPPPLLDRLLLPQSPGEAINSAIMVGTDGLGDIAEGGIKLLSSIGEDAKLVKYAEEAGKSVQKGLDSLTEALSKGNTNPGIGTKGLGKGISYARARDGARVFFQQAGNQIEILAKASKANESQVINYLKSLYF
jgi:RHS repeat-associated protein